MRPIEIRVTGRTTQSPVEICEAALDMDRWSEFQGYMMIPGIAEAHFEKKTPEVVGSRIRVHNKDGSSHVEEILEWDPTRKVVFRFQAFGSPLKYLASHFIETWLFSPAPNATVITRQMTMHPNGISGWLLLFPVSRMMKRAFEKNKHQLTP